MNLRAARYALVFLLEGAILLGQLARSQTDAPKTGEIAWKATGRPVRPGVYVPPNEQHPAVALPIWRQSNHAAYISVGTERAFMGAAVTSASALVVTDYDPEVVRFAQINRALLAASRSREDYLTLRLSAPAPVWRERAAAVQGEDRKTLTALESWTFWDQAVRKNTSGWSGAFEHFNRPGAHSDDAFAQTNYLFDDKLFEHLRQLAKDDLITARTLDLRDEKAVRGVCADVRAKGLKLGVVDTSNVPDASEAGTAAAGNYVKWFSECAEDSTIFLSTERANRPAVTYWSYYAFTGRAVKGKDAATITHMFDAEIAKLKIDSETRAILDDRDAVGK